MPPLNIKKMYCARLQIMHYHVTFETTCYAAYDHLKHLDRFFHVHDYQFIESSITSSQYPTVRYTDHPEYRCTFISDENLLLVSAPWEEIPRRPGDYSLNSMLVVPIWHATELTRQISGEYFFHASAVVKNNRAIVLSGPAEAGKIITAFKSSVINI